VASVCRVGLYASIPYLGGIAWKRERRAVAIERVFPGVVEIRTAPTTAQLTQRPAREDGARPQDRCARQRRCPSTPSRRSSCVSCAPLHSCPEQRSARHRTASGRRDRTGPSPRSALARIPELPGEIERLRSVLWRPTTYAAGGAAR